MVSKVHYFSLFKIHYSNCMYSLMQVYSTLRVTSIVYVQYYTIIPRYIDVWVYPYFTVKCTEIVFS